MSYSKSANKTLLFLLLLTGACTKGPEAVNPPQDAGSFAATINGKEWKPNLHTAKYYPKWGQLYISATDYTIQLTAGINVDINGALKQYSLQNLGNNAAELNTGVEKYNTEHNATGAGGSFVLSKLDTVKRLLSGSLAFTGYSADRSSKIAFAANTIVDIPLVVDTSSYDGSYAGCSFSGIVASDWSTKNFFAKVTCVQNNVNKTLELHVASLIGGFPANRYILFRIPLNNTAGNYAVYPDMPPYFYCGTLNITSRLNLNNYYNSYYATTGTINIEKIDTAAHLFNASYTVTYKDSTARQETIRVSNGIIRLNHWAEIN